MRGLPPPPAGRPGESLGPSSVQGGGSREGGPHLSTEVRGLGGPGAAGVADLSFSTLAEARVRATLKGLYRNRPRSIFQVLTEGPTLRWGLRPGGDGAGPDVLPAGWEEEAARGASPHNNTPSGLMPGGFSAARGSFRGLSGCSGPRGKREACLQAPCSPRPPEAPGGLALSPSPSPFLEMSSMRPRLGPRPQGPGRTKLHPPFGRTGGCV